MNTGTRTAVALTDEEAAQQSLTHGAAGTALLHIERAMAGSGSWDTARAHIQQAVVGPVDAAEHAGLYYGAPAITFLLHTASRAHPSYRAACDSLYEHVLHLTRRRLATAADRIERHEHTTFAEFDLFYGLTGLGALLLRHSPGSDVLASVLRYVITLTKPCRRDGLDLPGWWVDHNPDEILPTPGGHANLGMAHGAAGLLALLSLATIHSCAVGGQLEAIAVLTDWFDRWRQDGSDGQWWPEWLTRDDLSTGHLTQSQAGRPSWCYGTVGIARALQLAAIATHDPRRQQTAEHALAASLTGTHLDQVTEPGICHGMAGIYQTAYRAAHDSRNPAISDRLPQLAARLAHHADSLDVQQSGLLTGSAGVELVRETARHAAPPRTGWDACLLIT